MRKQKLSAAVFAVLTALSCCGCGGSVPSDAPAEIPACACYVALTFDDGPRQGTTGRLLDGLRERGASATFFLVGEEAEANPELVKRMKAEGHQIGNHTWSHVRLDDAAPLKRILRTSAAALPVFNAAPHAFKSPVPPDHVVVSVSADADDPYLR